jgi:putative hydrolase of the HAD superfamily
MIELVALDADDTLWHNEPIFRTTQGQFRDLLARYVEPDLVDARLDETERRNLQHFGYGVKGFVLSMIETALDLTDGRLDGSDVRTIIGWGRDMLRSPVELLDGARQAVEALAAEFRLILLTKGDLFHQESKLARSGLGPFFTGVEIVSEKDPEVYRAVMRRYGVRPEEFVMVGNSLKSDVLPVLEAGAHAVFVPYAITWVHERVAPDALRDAHYHEIRELKALAPLLHELGGASRRSIGRVEDGTPVPGPGRRSHGASTPTSSTSS